MLLRHCAGPDPHHDLYPGRRRGDETALCPHPPEIRTINGVSSKIIAYYAQNCGKRPPFILAEDESALAKLVSDLYRDLCGEYPTQSVVKELRKSIAYAKNMMLPEERLGELDTGFEKFPELYREYGKALRDNKWMDYDDQMVYAKKILELHEDVRTHFQNRFPYICVDESRTPPGSSTPSSACWPGKAATSSW